MRRQCSTAEFAWGARPGSNRRPPGPQPGVLPLNYGHHAPFDYPSLDLAATTTEHVTRRILAVLTQVSARATTCVAVEQGAPRSVATTQTATAHYSTTGSASVSGGASVTWAVIVTSDSGSTESGASPVSAVPPETFADTARASSVLGPGGGTKMVSR